MPWLLSTIIASFIFTSAGVFSDFSDGNLMIGNSPQLNIMTPQSVLQGDETERFEKNYPLDANGRVSVSNVNGSIEIETWDKNEVKLEVLKIADSKERLAEVTVDISANEDSFKVETRYGTWKNGRRNWNCSGQCKLEVKYKLIVPRNAVLNEIETVNGSVLISNAGNITKASAVNGNVKAANLRGNAEIETVNGTTEVSFEKLNNDSQIKLSTVNGRVDLIIPSDADATIKADTVNGNISNDFNLPVKKGKYVGRNLYGKLGDGSVKINLESVNGRLSIKRSSDGRDTKPVVNLLTLTDDEDNISAITNREINKSIREANRIAAEEVKKAAIASRAEISKRREETSKAMQQMSQDIAISAREAALSEKDMARINQEVMKATQIGLNTAFGFNRAPFSRVEEKSEIISVKGNPNLTINAKDCNVTVHGWDRSEVKYRLLKMVRMNGQSNTSVKVDHSVSNNHSEVVINAEISDKGEPKPVANTARSSGSAVFAVPALDLSDETLRIEVFVPKKSNLRILTDKEIRIEGISGNIDLSGNEGAINVRDSDGSLKIRSQMSMVRVIGFSGAIDSRTEEGTNFFEGRFDKFNARSEAGIIVLTLQDNTNAELNANTEISLEGFNPTSVSEDEDRVKLGSGGVIYYLNADEVYVRNVKKLTAE